MPTTNSAGVRVIVVEDSLVQQAHLVDVLEADGDIEVVATAMSAPEAIALIADKRPDVVTLDLQIPGGGGQRVIHEVMAATPTPILVLSAAVEDPRSVPAIEALVSGALVALPKPARWTIDDENQLRRTVRSLRNVMVVRHPRGASSTRRTIESTGASSPPIVGLAASAGGPPALAKVLEGMTGVPAPVLVVQHIHHDFVDGLATWLQRSATLSVQIAAHGVGPAGTHLRVDTSGRIELAPEPETTHRPSADELFLSLARNVGATAVGVVLTGMGDDGARGLLELRRSGAHTIAQDEATSAVFGMPKAADRAGAVIDLLPLDMIGPAIVRALRMKQS
jgi:two-component system chemotaxis response regulator CheB